MECPRRFVHAGLPLQIDFHRGFRCFAVWGCLFGLSPSLFAGLNSTNGACHERSGACVGAIVVSSFVSRSYSVSSSKSVLVAVGLPVKNLLVTKSFNHVAKALHCCLNTETVGSFVCSFVRSFVCSFVSALRGVLFHLAIGDQSFRIDLSHRHEVQNSSIGGLLCEEEVNLVFGASAGFDRL